MGERPLLGILRRSRERRRARLSPVVALAAALLSGCGRQDSPSHVSHPKARAGQEVQDGARELLRQRLEALPEEERRRLEKKMGQTLSGRPESGDGGPAGSSR